MAQTGVNYYYLNNFILREGSFVFYCLHDTFGLLEYAYWLQSSLA